MRARFVLVAALLVLAMCASCGGGGAGGGAGGAPDENAAATVGLTWSGGDAAAGYVVHWGTTSGAYPHAVDVGKPGADSHGAVTVTIALDGADASAARFFFAITSYDAAGDSSGYSNELSIAVSALSIAPSSG
jgi:hypothetical protein